MYVWLRRSLESGSFIGFRTADEKWPESEHEDPVEWIVPVPVHVEATVT